jgi:hypothetical protein
MYYYKFFKVIYEKTACKDTTFVSKNLYIKIKLRYRFPLILFRSKKLGQTIILKALVRKK